MLVAFAAMADAAPLTADEVLRIARLARLRLDPQRLEAFRAELASMLNYVAVLNELDVTGVEPLMHPGAMAARLADDVPEPVGGRSPLMLNAPAMEGPYLSVPKVLDEAAGAG